MAYHNPETAKIQNSHASKMAWTEFYSASGSINATVRYWIDQLPANEREQIKQSMLKVQSMDIQSEDAML